MKEKGEEYASDKYKNKNLLKREIMLIFKNVTMLMVTSQYHPLSLESLLELVDGTQITRIILNGEGWVESAMNKFSFDNDKYEIDHYESEIGNVHK